MRDGPQAVCGDFGNVDTTLATHPIVTASFKENTMLRSTTTVLAASFVVIGMAMSQAQAASPVHTGDVTLLLKTAKGLQKNGSPDPSKDQICATQFAKVLGQKVHSTYSINTQTLIMSAKSTLMGKTYSLHPLGIYGQYAFGLYMTPKPGPLPLYGVLFSVNDQFASPVSNLILELNAQTNCLISSADNPLGGPERIRFGTSP